MWKFALTALATFAVTMPTALAETDLRNNTITVDFKIERNAPIEKLYRSVIRQADRACKKAPWVRRAYKQVQYNRRRACRADLVTRLAIQADFPELAIYQNATLARRRGGRR